MFVMGLQSFSFVEDRIILINCRAVSMCVNDFKYKVKFVKIVEDKIENRLPETFVVISDGCYH